MKTIGCTRDQLARIAGGVFNPTVANCKAAFKSGQITMKDIEAFKNDHGYRGNTAASKACLGAASYGAFGFTESQVKRTFGIE